MAMFDEVKGSPFFVATGVRGSHATTDARFARYGGDTTGIMARSSTGEILVADAGTGFPRLAPVLNEASGFSLFVSHPHLDHIQGIFYLDTFKQPDKHIAIYCEEHIRHAIEALCAPPFLPRRLSQFPSPPQWHILRPVDTFETPSFQARVMPLTHPGGAQGIALVDKGTRHSLMILTDLEIHRDVPFGEQPALEAVYAVASDLGGIDALIIDAPFAPDAYVEGMGHSDTATAIAFARHIRATEIYLSHHAPASTDEVLDARRAAIDDKAVHFLSQWTPHPF